MSLRSIIIIAALLLILGLFPYLFHQAAQPSISTRNPLETTLAWTDGPDVELNTASLRKLNAEVQQLAKPDLHGEMNPFAVVSSGKRKVKVLLMGAKDIPDELENKVDAYVQKRLPDLAKEQAGG